MRRHGLVGAGCGGPSSLRPASSLCCWEGADRPGPARRPRRVLAAQPDRGAAGDRGRRRVPHRLPSTTPLPTSDPDAETADHRRGEHGPFTGSEVTVVGDSVTVAAAPSLEASLPGVAVDAEVSRSVYAAQSVLETADAAGARPVVVSLATNGPVETSAFDSILEYSDPLAVLVLVTGWPAHDLDPRGRRDHPRPSPPPTRPGGGGGLGGRHLRPPRACSRRPDPPPAGGRRSLRPDGRGRTRSRA